MRRKDDQTPIEPRPGAASRRSEQEGTGGALTRRRVLAAGGVAAISPRALVARQAPTVAGAPLGWTPRFLDSEQATLLTQLCELLLPRTETPGATDAGVPEWIDLALSLADAEEQLAFLGGLGWVDRFARESFGRPFLELSADEQTGVLREISDEHEEVPEELEAGAAFFRELKAKTLFAYFTSKTGRVEMLGLPEKVRRETFRGCSHGEDDEHA